MHSTCAAYKSQWPLVEDDPAAEAAYHCGLQRLTDIFLDCIVVSVEDRLRTGDLARALKAPGCSRQMAPLGGRHCLAGAPVPPHWRPSLLRWGSVSAEKRSRPLIAPLICDGMTASGLGCVKALTCRSLEQFYVLRGRLGGKFLGILG